MFSGGLLNVATSWYKFSKNWYKISKKIQILELNFFQNDCRAHLWSSVVIFYSGKTNWVASWLYLKSWVASWLLRKSRRSGLHAAHGNVNMLTSERAVLAVCCSVLQCVAVCCSACGRHSEKSDLWLYSVASWLLRISTQGNVDMLTKSARSACSVLQCVAVCCSVLQCVW